MFFKKFKKTAPELYYPQNDIEIWFRDTYVLWSYIFCFDWEFVGGCERDEFNCKDMKRMLSNDWFVDNKKELIAVKRTLQADGITNKDAWDLCRAMQLLACGYIANFYERDELNAHSLDLAIIIQNIFTSWEELVQSYLDGFETWGLSTMDEPDAYLALRERRNAYNVLRIKKNAPYSVNWYLQLKI